MEHAGLSLHILFTNLQTKICAPRILHPRGGRRSWQASTPQPVPAKAAAASLTGPPWLEFANPGHWAEVPASCAKVLPMPCRAADQQSFRNTTVCGCYRSWSVWVHQTLVVALMEHNSHAFPGFLLKQRSLFALHLLKQQREWKLGTGDSLRRMGPVSRCHRKDVDGRCGMLQM